MSLNIFEIWDAIGRQVPFAVRRDHWGIDQYAIVESIECDKMPYGKAYGYHMLDGVISNRFDYDEIWKEKRIIPCCGIYQWTLVDDLEINKGKIISQKYRSRLFTASSQNSEFTFGKYKGESIEQVFLKDPKYIEWAIINNDTFCLTEKALSYLEEIGTDFVFNQDARIKNQSKLLRALKI